MEHNDQNEKIDIISDMLRHVFSDNDEIANNHQLFKSNAYHIKSSPFAYRRKITPNMGMIGIKAIVEKKDKRGYRICYDDQTGSRVACNKVTPPKVKPKKKDEKKEEDPKKKEKKEKQPAKQKVTAEEAKSAIDKAKEGGIDSSKMSTLVDTLNGMAVAELQKLRKALGAKTATRKAEIIDKLKENLATAQPRASEPPKQEQNKPEPKTEESKPKQEEEKKKPSEPTSPIKAIREAVLSIGDTADKIQKEIKALSDERGTLWGEWDKAKKNSKKIKVINARLEEIAKEQSVLLKNKVDARKESHKKIVELLKGDSKLSSSSSGLDGTAEKSIDEGITFINSVLKGGITNEIQFKPVVPEKDGVSRSHYNPTDNGIRLDAVNKSPSVVVHEVGHWLENNVPGANKAVRDFLNKRVGNESYVSLAKLFPGHGYDEHEMGRKDNFDKLWGNTSSRPYYAGKSYGNRDTEILSMGLDTLYDDPVAFAKKDPEYFELIVSILDGSGRVGTTAPKKDDDDGLIDLDEF